MRSIIKDDGYTITQQDTPHFVTLTVLHWIPVFTRPQTVEIILDSLRFLMQEGLKVHAYVVLENHLHLILQSSQLDKDIARLKSFTARKLLDYLAFYKKAHKNDRTYQFWQEGVHPELIQSDSIMRQKIDYIHHNPVKRGYVDLAEHWRYSSARNYNGENELIEICKLC